MLPTAIKGKIVGIKNEKRKKGLPIILLFTHKAIIKDKIIEDGIVPNAYQRLLEITFQKTGSLINVS